MLDDEPVVDERVSEGNTTKTGGEGPYALLQGRGVGRRGFPGRPAQPLSPLFYDGTQSRPSKDDPRCNRPNCLRRRLGGMEPNRSGAGGEQTGLPTLRGWASPASRTASPHRSAKHISDRTTGGMERSALVSRPNGHGARSVNDDATQGQ